MDNTNKKDPNKALEKIKNKKLLSKGSYKSMLLQLKNWIETLKPKINKTTWDNYSSNNTYKKDELFKKQKIVNEFCKIHKPYLLADIGCNDGLYSIESLNAGARKVIGFDIDLNTINSAKKLFTLRCLTLLHQVMTCPLAIPKTHPLLWISS